MLAEKNPRPRRSLISIVISVPIHYIRRALIHSARSANSWSQLICPWLFSSQVTGNHSKSVLNDVLSDLQGTTSSELLGPFFFIHQDIWWTMLDQSMKKFSLVLSHCCSKRGSRSPYSEWSIMQVWFGSETCTEGCWVSAFTHQLSEDVTTNMLLQMVVTQDRIDSNLVLPNNLSLFCGAK